MKKTVCFISLGLLFFGTASSCFGEQSLLANYTTQPPVVDGVPNDPAWENAQEIITIDKVTKLPISIKAVYSDKEIFVQVNFDDPDESRTHKSWTWDKGREIYTVGHDREDIFIFKWNMTPGPVDLSIYADNSHHADIWYWKACRTDPTGYADDKSHLLSPTEERNTTKIISGSGKTMHLLRRGDEGTSAYRIDLITDYQGEILPRYIPQQPTMSRSDVKAKGIWENGKWTIEFRRDLNTDHHDDVQFTTGRKFLFAVSRYEIAGRKANNELSAPLYGTGDVNEPLWLEFIKK